MNFIFLINIEQNFKTKFQILLLLNFNKLNINYLKKKY